MKRIYAYFLILIFGLSYLPAASRSIDRIACKKVEDTLKIIGKVVNNINCPCNTNVVAAVDFITELSKVPYEGAVEFEGPIFPKKSFYINCMKWFAANKRRIKWDAKQNKIYLIEK